MYNEANKKTVSRARLLLILALAALLGAAAVIYTVSSAEDAASSDRLAKAKNWEDVKQYQYSQIRGLKRAEELRLAKTFNYGIPIPGTDKTLTIHEIWYNERDIHVLFSYETEYKANTGLEENRDGLRLPVLEMKAYDETRKHFSLLRSHLSSLHEGIYFKGRYYGTAIANSITDEDGKPLTQVKNMELADIRLRDGEAEYDLPPVVFAVDYDSANEPVEVVPIHRSYTAFGRTVTIERLELGGSSNRLYYSYKSDDPDRRLNGIEINISAGDDSGWNFGLSTAGNDGPLFVEFDPYDERPSSVRLSLSSIQDYGDPGEFRFTVDATKYDHSAQMFTETVNEKIATLFNTDVYLDKLTYENKGITFHVRHEYTDPEPDKPYVRLRADLPYLTSPDETAQQTNRPQLLSVVNEKGEKGVSSAAGSSFNDFEMLLDKSFVERSKTITVTVSNLVTEIVTDWETTVEIPKQP
ncbi:hypothetical protein ACFSL6_19725 [Paenibacillus thailandensis]|uniref:DUF4179 domain-containing protein n=1 Tax=Paenibacillus thailandensis TaxID=393250 RepID=A0ABW5QUY0_9BACL